MTSANQLRDVFETDGSENIAAKRDANWSVPYYVKGLALGIPTYLVAIHMWAWILIAPHFYHRADFRQFYAGAYLVRTGHSHELYDFNAQKAFEDRLVSREPENFELAFVSPGYHALLLTPFSFLPYRLAYISFVGLNFVLLGLCLVLLWPEMQNLRHIFKWLPLAMVLGFYPVGWTLILGQDSIVLTTLLIGAYVLFKKNRDTTAGIVTALALFKFQIVLPIALLFILWKRWRFVKGFMLCALVLGGVSLWLTGIQQSELYVKSLLSIASLKPSSGMAEHIVYWPTMANVNGLVFGVFDGVFSTLWIKILSILASIGVLAFTARRGSRIQANSILLLLSIPCAVLVGYHTYMHDLTPLLLPTVILLNSFLPSEGGGPTDNKVIARIAALMFVAPVINSFVPNHTYLAAFVVAGILVALGATRKPLFVPFTPV
jgi:hypothetical protein